MGDKPWFLYMVQSEKTGYVYVGVTVLMARRLRQHNGEIKGGARALRGQRPVRLLWCAEVEGGKIPALRCEYWLKRHSKKWKLEFARLGSEESTARLPEKLPYGFIVIKKEEP